MSTLLLFACGSGSKENAVAPPPGVLVAKVSMRQILETVEYVGQTVAVNDVSLRAQVSGYLLKKTFDEGQDVEKGAELFTIDPALYEAGVAAAAGAVAEAKAEVLRTDKDLKRYRTLIKSQEISQQQLDKAEVELLQASANLKTVEAQLLRAKIDLSYTVIKAPFNGRIGRAGASVGDLVAPQSGELARLVELNPIYANFSVSERDVIAAKRRYQAGDSGVEMDRIEVRLRLPDGSLYEHVGRVDFIDNVVDRRTGTVVLRAHFDKLLEGLKVPLSYAKHQFPGNGVKRMLLIGGGAVIPDLASYFEARLGFEVRRADPAGLIDSPPELLQIADAVAREKSIDRQIVIAAMEDAIQKAARSRYGSETDVRAEINPRTTTTYTDVPGTGTWYYVTRAYAARMALRDAALHFAEAQVSVST